MKTYAVIIAMFSFLLLSCSGGSSSGVHSGSKFPWDPWKCETVEGKTQYSWASFGSGYTSPYHFYVKRPSEAWNFSRTIRLRQSSSCRMNASSKMSYSTNNWLCVGDTVKVNGRACTIDYID